MFTNKRIQNALMLVLLLAGATSAPQAQAQTTSTVTRTVSFEYDANGTVSRKTIEPDDTSLQYRVVTDYVPNEFGLIKSETQSWQDPFEGPNTRTVKTDYDARGRFVRTVTNAKSQVESFTYDDGTGSQLTHTDVNSLVTTWTYDPFGRKTSELRPDQTSTTWAYRKCIDSCLNNATSVTVTRHWMGLAQTDVPTEQFDNVIGKVALTRTWGFDGTPVLSEKVYDDRGRLQKVSRPRFAIDAAVWTTYVRDDLARVTQIQSPNQTGSGVDLTNYVYHGLTRTSTNAKLQSRTEFRDGTGKLRKVTDALSKSTEYVYDSFGNLVRVTDARGNQIVIGVDSLGRKTALDDPDLGQWRYVVDPLGQTLQQTDAKGQLTRYYMDELGRTVRRLEPDMDSRWEFDTAAKGVGKLAEAYTFAANAKDYRRIHSYDGYGRLSSVTTRLDWDYVTTTVYDGFGRVSQSTHQRNAVGGSGGPSIAFVNRYNAFGDLYQIDRVHDGVTALLWQAQQQDAEGNVRLEKLGNDVVTQRNYNLYTGRLSSIVSGTGGSLQNDTYAYDVLGNLTQRIQRATPTSLLTEDLVYDELNRLKSSVVAGQTAKDTSYDEVGDIVLKSGVGMYGYNTSGPGSVRPHAVSWITGTVAGLANPTLEYDDNGNLLTGLGRSYAWTSYDMPSRIDKLVSGAGVERTAFLYGADHDRIRQTVSPMSGGIPGAATTTIWYGGAMEKEIDTAANTTTIRTYMPAALGFVEEKIVGTSVAAATTGTRNPMYHLHDHLRSVLAVVDQNQTLLQRMSYDPWGRRRNVDGTDDTGPQWGTLKNNQDHRGYTGHESLDRLGLVHMNARMYDPILGRHTSADPTVPDPADAQAFNRYSYVLNNALAYTDPTGLNGAAQTNKVPDQPSDGKERVDYGTSICGNGNSRGCKIAYQAPMTDEARGALVQKIDRAFEKAVATKDVRAMQQAFDRYMAVAREGNPSDAAHITMWSHILLRAQQDAGMGPVVATVTAMATASFAMGMGGMGPQPMGAGRSSNTAQTSSDGPAQGEKLLFRRGEYDTKALLQSQAKAAEKEIGIHGVSTSTSPAAKPGQVVRCATCSSVEAAGFRVTQTGRDPKHHTVELPNPITPEIVRIWNDLFK